MKRNKEQTLKDALNSMKEEYSLSKRLSEVKIVNAWFDLAGPGINKYTKEVFIKNNKLFVKLNSSVARNELSLIKQGLLEALNKKSTAAIKEIVFI